MSTVLLVRHGATPWTEQERVQGWATVPLSDMGRRQAAATAELIADRWPDVDRIITSDLRRTRMTAQRIADELDVSITENPEFRERNFGELQGMDDEFYHGEWPDDDADHERVDRHPIGGESWQQTVDRVQAEWGRLADAVADGETVAVVTHYGPILSILSDIYDIDFDGITLTVDTGSVTVVDVDGEPDVVERNITDHLPDAK